MLLHLLELEENEIEIIKSSLVEAYRSCARKIALINRELMQEPAHEEIKEKLEQDKREYAILKKKIDEIINGM